MATAQGIPERRNYLPTLPFELKFAILSQIPPIQLFTLRRVSQVWNYMLSDPFLLEEINQQLPFLTSAPDLTSRMKRRMRMIRKEPIWIKPVKEVFPWARNVCLEWGAFSLNVMAFWKGWVVFVDRRASNKWNSRDTPIVKLRIEGLGEKLREQYPAVEVDMWEEFQRSYPEAYRDALAQGRNFQLREFHIQDGKVVVLLIGSMYGLGETRGIDQFFLIYSIPTGTLIQAIHSARPPSSVTTGFLHYYSASKTHFLSSFTIREEIPVSERYHKAGDSIPVQWVFVYSLTDGSLVQQIRIGFPSDIQESDFAKYYQVDSEPMRGAGGLYGFDHLNRFWLLNVHAPIIVSYFGTGSIMEPMASPTVIPGSDLPTVTCGNAAWTIVPTVLVPGLERDSCKQINFHLRIKNHDRPPALDRAESYKQPWINIYDNHLCIFETAIQPVPEYAERTERHHQLATLQTINAMQHPMGNGSTTANANLPERPEAYLLIKMNIHALRASKSFDHDPHANIDFKHKVESRTYLAQHESKAWFELSTHSAAWGLFANSQTTLTHQTDYVTALQGFLDLYVWPFHYNDIYYPNGLQRRYNPADSPKPYQTVKETILDSPTRAMTPVIPSPQAHTETIDEAHEVPISQQARIDEQNIVNSSSGAAVGYVNERSTTLQALLEASVAALGSQPEPDEIITVDRLGTWIDDGLVPWMSNIGGSWQPWLVCYEEAWAI